MMDYDIRSQAEGEQEEVQGEEPEKQEEGEGQPAQ